MVKSAKFGLNLASEALWFRNKAIYLKSETRIGRANNWPISPNLMYIAPQLRELVFTKLLPEKRAASMCCISQPAQLSSSPESISVIEFHVAMILITFFFFHEGYWTVPSYFRSLVFVFRSL